MFIDWLPYIENVQTKYCDYQEKYCKSLLIQAYALAALSEDPSTQVGAFLYSYNKAETTISIYTGTFNGIGSYLKTTKKRLNNRPEKYLYLEHAERRCIYQAAKRGRVTDGLIMVAPWYSCPDCAKAIVESGIQMVMGHKTLFDRTPKRWRKPIKIGLQILEEAGVECIAYEGLVGEQILFDGEIIDV